MDSSYYAEIAGTLRGLLARLRNRISEKDATLVAEFIDVNELGLALEQLADALGEDEQPLTVDEHGEMIALAERMELGQRVSRALTSCPQG